MDSDIRLECKFSFDKLTALLAPQLEGIEIRKGLRIRNCVLRSDGTWIYADTDVTGIYRGTIGARFGLNYDSNASRFRLEQLKVHLRNSGLLARSANWILSNFFGQTLDKQFDDALNEQFQIAIDEQMKRYGSVQLDNGMVIQAHLRHFNFENIRWDTEFLYFHAVAKGSLEVRL